MSPPHFPITPDGLRGRWRFGGREPGPFNAEGFDVEAREIPHKGGRTFGYRVSDGHSTVAYLPGHCPTARTDAEPDALAARHAGQGPGVSVAAEGGDTRPMSRPGFAARPRRGRGG